MKKYLMLLTVIIISVKIFAQTAPAQTSLAIGTNTSASGQSSLAVGNSSQASGQNSSAIGSTNKAIANSSIAIGENCNATGVSSIAIGNGSTASGNPSIALGYYRNIASGNKSTAMGSLVNTNNKVGAFAIGDVSYDNAELNNDADNQMIMRFANGYKLHFTNSKLAFSINPNGTVGIDQSNLNNGTINAGLIFGLQSGEGIASKRTGGGNQYGLDFYSNFMNRMSITNAGKVGIGTTAPQQMLSVAGSMNIDQNNANTGALNPGITFGSGSGEGISSNRSGDMNRNSYGLDFYAGGINRLSIRNDGRIGIGIAVPQHSLHVVGNILASGTITAVGITNPSDIRYKKNILPIANALKTVMALAGYTYLLRKEEFPEWNFESKTQYGLIAQNVETVLPEIVYQGNDGYKSIEYTRIIPFLIESIKEQQKQIDELKKLVLELMKK